MLYQHPLRHKVKPTAYNSQLRVTTFVYHGFLRLPRLEFQGGHANLGYNHLTITRERAFRAEKRT